MFQQICKPESCKTNWYVLTGAPCSGKTTVLYELEKEGFSVSNEAARVFIENERKKGIKIEELMANEYELKMKILKFMIQTESNLPKNEIFFLDRAIPDAVAYFKVAGFNSSYAEFYSTLFRYRKIFLLDPFKFEDDGVRVESFDMAMKLDKFLEIYYKKLNYEVFRVPINTPEKRKEFILSHLKID